MKSQSACEQLSLLDLPVVPVKKPPPPPLQVLPQPAPVPQPINEAPGSDNIPGSTQVEDPTVASIHALPQPAPEPIPINEVAETGNTQLFPQVEAPADDLTPASLKISDLLEPYEHFLRSSKKSKHTIGSFTSDIRKLGAYLRDQTVDNLDKQDLEAFLSAEFLAGSADTTVYREYTTLKNFFKWLYESDILPVNIALRLIFKRGNSPLPEILNSEEADKFIEASKETPQEHLVALLLLGGGLKRSEFMALIFSDIDISNPVRPFVNVRSTTHTFKNRNVDMPLEFVDSFQKYLTSLKENSQIKVAADSLVFNLTERTLNYIVEGIAQRAAIKKKVSSQILRDTFAVLLLKAGEKEDKVLKQLGLALTDCNKNIRIKYRTLAEKTK